MVLALIFLFFKLHHNWALVTAVFTNILRRRKPEIKAAGQVDLWASASWTINLGVFSAFQVFQNFTYIA